MDIDVAKELFINNFVGGAELEYLVQRLGFKIDWNSIDMQIPFNDIELMEAAKDGYILVLVPPCCDKKVFSIRNLREKFGMDPDKEGPCFYNQDWYLNEDFIDFTIEPNWYLLQKKPLDYTRAVIPEVILTTKNDINFPSAVLCTYTFFAYRLAYGENLWETDFVWCSDLDHNGDRIYVGKYHDVDGVNNDGFSIHRYLKLRPCYSAISVR